MKKFNRFRLPLLYKHGTYMVRIYISSPSSLQTWYVQISSRCSDKMSGSWKSISILWFQNYFGMYGRWMNGFFGKVLEFCMQKNDKMSGTWKSVSILWFQNYFGMYGRWMNGFFGKVLEFCEQKNEKNEKLYKKATPYFSLLL